MSWDHIWEKVFNSQEWGKYPSESLIRFVAKNFYQKDRAKIKILEVGCGPGANIWYLAREGFDAYGIDGSQSAILQSTKRLEKEGLRAHLSVGDIVQLPYSSDFFDAVIDQECVYCNSKKDSEKILQGVKKVLKPNGLFYSRTFASEMYVGQKNNKAGDFEFTDISDGPFAGKGFVRLIDRKGIDRLYGEYFSIESVDWHEYTSNNGVNKIFEWIIVSQKE